MQNILGGLNFNAPLSAEDYASNQNAIEAEILSRFLLSTGSPPNSSPQTGIVDILNPTQISSSETSRPFLVTVSQVDSLKVNVNPGTAVTASGAIVQSTGSLSLALARTQANDKNVIFIENEIVPSGQQVMNDYQQVLWTQQSQNTDNLKCVLLDDWLNPSLFPTIRKKNIVVLAVISVLPTISATLELSIDLTQATYAFNRPWFSIKDLQHRSYIGSGTVTAENPHGTAFNDLSIAGTVNLFQGLSNTGIIVSRDLVVNKMTGAVFCSEAIPLNRILTDNLGLITKGSPYNRIGARYVELQAIPTRLGGVFVTSTPANSIAAEIIPGTNVLVFSPLEVLNSPLTVHYTQTSALLPPVQFPTNQLSFSQPAAGEVIVAEGLTIDQIPDPILNLEGSGPISRIYRAYQQGNGTLLTFPQILIPSTVLNAIGTSLYAPLTEMIAPARIQLGICKANAVAGMEIQIEVFGTDINGATISEILTVSTANGYMELSIPNMDYDSQSQIVTSSTIFSSVTNIQLVSRDLDGPLTLFQVWAAIEPGTSAAVNDYVPVCDIYWNGQGIEDLKDVRNISANFVRQQFNVMNSIGELELDAGKILSQLDAVTLNNVSLHLMSEDFEDLHFFDTASEAAITPATGFITINDNDLIANNDKITLKPGIILTATTSATPNLAIGEFQKGATAQTTINNIIATVNDPTFNSGITASVGIGATVNLAMNNPRGSFGNAYTITKTLASSTSIQVSGFTNGFDAYGSCYLDRAQIGLKSIRIPDNSVYDLASYKWRGRYRCRAVGIPGDFTSKTDFAVVLHQLKRYEGYSIRIRGALEATPGIWTPWEVMSIASSSVAGVFVYSFSQPVFKVQVEVFGNCRGISLFALVAN